MITSASLNRENIRVVIHAYERKLRFRRCGTYRERASSIAAAYKNPDTRYLVEAKFFLLQDKYTFNEKKKVHNI